MCKTPPKIDEKLIIDTIQEYSRRKGVFIRKKEAKTLTSNFKKKYKRLPSFKELWSLADKVTLQKGAGEKVSLEEKVARKMAEMKKREETKKARKEVIEVKRAGVEKVEEKVEKVEEKVEEVKSKCSKCGYVNPGASKFCLECGTKLG